MFSFYVFKKLKTNTWIKFATLPAEPQIFISWPIFSKKFFFPKTGVMVHTYNLNTVEAEAGGSCSTPAVLHDLKKPKNIFLFPSVDTLNVYCKDLYVLCQP